MALRNTLMAAMLGLIVAGCASTEPANVARNPVTFQAPDKPDRSAVNESYRLGILDTVTITVFQVADLTGDYQIDPTGYLNLPLVGRVDAQDKTLPELQASVKQLYGQKYLANPDIRIDIKQAISQRVTVDGAVAQPGLYPLSGDTTLVQAVAMAKGTTQDANTGRVVIFRKINGQREAASFDLSKIRRGELSDPAVYGDDIVVVDGSKVRQRFHDLLSTIPAIALFSAI